MFPRRTQKSKRKIDQEDVLVEKKRRNILRINCCTLFLKTLLRGVN